MTSGGFLGQMVVLFLVFKETPYSSPQWLYQLTFPLTVQEGSLFSTPSPAFIVCRLFNDGHSDWCEVIPHCSFNLHFSNNERCWAFFQMFWWYLYLTHNYFTSTHTLPCIVGKISLILLHFFFFNHYNYSKWTPQGKERFFCDCLLSCGERLGYSGFSRTLFALSLFSIRGQQMIGGLNCLCWPLLGWEMVSVELAGCHSDSVIQKAIWFICISAN